MAHGTGFTRHEVSDAVSLSFYYATGDPLAYCSVAVFSPENAELEFQNGRTDQRGGFAFIPNHTGTWRVFVTDGRGHAVRAEVAVETALQETAVLEGTHRIPPLMGALFGFSLLGNVFLVHRQKRGARQGP
ncbi:hypothetical protein [Desulfoluna sp.]|uniref:hypothetical protein n=1 Tax=Desulfoluna sp. TaxID=2045199 RepID=UPI002608AD8B|nr:hypothetical protein [Desulfoluna sp.]